MLRRSAYAAKIQNAKLHIRIKITIFAQSAYYCERKREITAIDVYIQRELSRLEVAAFVPEKETESEVNL